MSKLSDRSLNQDIKGESGVRWRRVALDFDCVKRVYSYSEETLVKAAHWVGRVPVK